jgi:ribose transport system substrate-binding protein
MVRRLAQFVLPVLVAVALAACGNGDTGTKPPAGGPKPDGGKAPDAAGQKKVYFITKASESEFWQIVTDGARKAAKKLGVHLIPQAPVSESDVSKQIAILETATASKPDAIVLAPTVADALVPGVEKAMGAGIPVVIIDSAISTEKITTFLASDNIAIGTVSADKMAEALKARTGKAEGEIACLTFMSGVGSLEKRKKGFLDQLKAKYPGIKVLAFQDAQGKQGTSLNIAQNYLTAYPDLKGIYANNQPTGDETVRALDMKKKKDLAVVVVDAGPQEVWGLENGFVDFVIVQKPWTMGHMGVEYALKAIRGEKLPTFVDTGIVAISPAMMKSGEAKEFLDPVAFHKND